MKKTADKTSNMFQLFLRYIAIITIMALGIFCSAGGVNYWQGWTYLILFSFLAYFSLIMVPSDLATERMNPGGSYKKWDKYFLAFYNPMTILIPAISSVDANRLHLFIPIPAYINVIGIVIIFLCSLFIIGQRVRISCRPCQGWHAFLHSPDKWR